MKHSGTKTLTWLAIAQMMSTGAEAQVATMDIPDLQATVMQNTPLLLGITYDGRSGMTGSPQYGQVGYHTPNATFIPEIDAVFSDFPMTTLRYPANAMMVGFDWKGAVGPMNQRTSQNLMGALGAAQALAFGFDEFMAMTEARGVSGADVQIMVTIYDSSTPNLTSTQSLAAIPNVVSNCADWVEYCNAPNDGSNPGGGTDWAAQRAANGHPAPYGIKIWNIGNEPWTSNEYGNTDTDFAAYEQDVTPIIDAMLAIDPTLKLTLPTTGQPQINTSWCHALLNSNLVAQGKIYGVSQHYFGTENQVNGNPPAQGIYAVSNQMGSLATAAANVGLKVFMGDYAHGIPNTQDLVQRDLAMQWQGANLMADMLVMLSQKQNIERCNFWAYGMPYAVWHPIRINAIGDYTLMPAAQLHKILHPMLLDHSVQVVSTSSPASDGNQYAVRSGAFMSSDQSLVNVIAVNRDRTLPVAFSITGLTGYQLIGADVLTGATLDADVIDSAPITADLQGQYTLPAMSVTILQYQATSVGTPDGMLADGALMLSPNPATDQLRLSRPVQWADVLDVNGRRLMHHSGPVTAIDCASLADGLYMLQTEAGTERFVVRH